MSASYSYSALSDFKTCPLRYYLSRIIGLEPRDAASNSHHLTWGAAFHAGLEQYYRWLKGSHSIAEPGEEGDLMVNRADVIEIAQRHFIEGYPTQLDLLDKAKTQENGSRALKLYIDRWAEEDRKWKVIEVEGPGRLDHTLDSGLGELHADLIVENLEHGGIYVIDHKTTGRQLGPRYWDRYSPNSQITYYIDYCQEKYGGCEGFIVNAVSLQWRDEKKINDANNVAWFSPGDSAMPWLAYSHYEERNYRGGPLGKAGPRIAAWGLTVAFERSVFQRSREQILQERLSTRQWIEQVESADRCLHCGDAEADHPDTTHAYEYYWPFNTNSCYSCAYRGGDDSGGICRPGYTWPIDREIISLGYRQVCRLVILVACPTCGGNGIDPSSRKLIRELATNDSYWRELRVYTLALNVCCHCKGAGLVDGLRCRMDKGHPGACDSSPVLVEQEAEIEIEIRS